MDPKSFFNVAPDEQIIRNNEKWFKFFNLIPKLSTAILAIIFFILGIVMGGVTLLIVWGAGAVFCLLNYVIAKLILSYKILHIYYLKKIAGGNMSFGNNIKDESEEELPEI